MRMTDASPVMDHSMSVTRPSMRRRRDSCWGELRNCSLPRTAVISLTGSGSVGSVSPQERLGGASPAQKIPLGGIFPQGIYCPWNIRAGGGESGVYVTDRVAGLSSEKPRIEVGENRVPGLH